MPVFPLFRVLSILLPPGKIFLLATLIAVTNIFLPGRGETQNRLYLPLAFRSVCPKDMVFLAFGDSITSCYMDSDLCAFPQCGYPQRLFDRLKSRFTRNFGFYNVGVGGERTAGGLDRLGDTLQHPGLYNVSPIFCAAAPTNFIPADSTNTLPDLIIIMEGTNDLGDWAASGNPSLETIEANLRALVQTSLESGMRVVLSTLTPVVPIDDHRELQGLGAAEMSGRIRQIAADYGVPLADVYAFFVNHPSWETELMSTDLAHDGLHPNELGFAVMAEVYYQTLLTQMTPDGCMN